MTECVS